MEGGASQSSRANTRVKTDEQQIHIKFLNYSCDSMLLWGGTGCQKGRQRDDHVLVGREGEVVKEDCF